MEAPPPEPGSLSWRLSSHPITLLCFLAFRCSNIVTYLLGLLFTDNYVLVFIVTIILLAVDFYYLKNIAGRRLVGLRWWNEVNPQTGESHWVFESADQGSRVVNKTDKRFFWMAMYVIPVVWVALAIVALVGLKFIWLTLVGIALVLTVTNTVAFSRCDRFGQAGSLATRALNTGGLATKLGGMLIGRFFK